MAKCRFLALLSLLLLGLAACGETPRLSPVNQVLPTARPTPADYNGVPDAATLGAIRRPTPLRATGGAGISPAVTATVDAAGDSDDDSIMADGGGPGDRLLDGTDPTVLARLYGTPGPGYVPGVPLAGLTPGAGYRGPRQLAPTPTLSTNPQAVKIESLKTTAVDFLSCYRQAAAKVSEVSRTARLVFASANILKPDRTAWSFLFIAPEGPRMWRVIFDSEGNRLDLREVAVAAAMVGDTRLIDPSKLVDSATLLDRAVANGLTLGLPVDVVNFQVEGQTKQPCFIFTNVAQGKQVVIQAYTGQIIRNDFGF